ncbi:dihydrodipicolinate synthase family protein [Ancylobacter oerskovii]|uniref:Dihydrodipicolinate synthase family protein n=1 Tax=Ancylobacter oerskovii TaxID=459519 RepID=A0ABW4YW42_9HYPH|nr:dihydrodipicolinate synthase family protein [Ancylobacter oerskovii]MBS7544094.1 dihydrodipicolinate synthase family protein [Ancylobacter oerskovii]
MLRSFNDRLAGIHAATIVPMRDDYSIDAEALKAHIRAVVAVRGVRGLLLNGHAGENFVLSRDEKCRVVALAREVAPDVLIVSGVNSESSLEAAGEAAALEAAGADGLLVFPPNSWALGHDEECVLLHHAFIRDATRLPLMLYGAPVSAGRMSYSGPLLSRLAREPRIVAIKEGSWEVAAYEENMRRLHAERPGFAVLGSGDEHLLACYMIGTVGSQVSLAAAVPQLIVDLWEAAEAKDWDRARQVHERIYPLAVAIYREAPGGRATARLKTCLKLLGQLDNDTLRPPQNPTTQQEIESLRRALDLALA